MQKPQTDLVELFHLYFSETFQRDVARRIRWLYRHAFELCRKRFHPVQAPVMRSYLRWMYLESELRRLGKKHRMPESIEPNECASQYHVEIASGPVVMTAAAVDHPRQVPRWAAYRETLATNNDIWLFPELAPPKPKNEASLHALLIHAPHPDNPQEIWFANIRFPMLDCTAYAPGKIELLGNFPATGSASGSASNAASARRLFEVENIEDQVLAEVRAGTEKKKAKDEKKA